LIQRIQSRSAFTRIRSEGVHLRSGVLSCTMILDSSLPGPQVGYAFSRKFGSAVRRNRIRRQLRELVKIRETQFPAGVFVFGASPRASQTSIEILARDLDGLLAKVAR
jgi:ribonuclease P protein component